MKRILAIVLIVILAATAMWSAFQLLDIFLEYGKADDSYAGLLEQVVSTTEAPAVKPTPKPTQSQAGETPSDTTPVETEPPGPADLLPWPVVDFAALKKINADVVGWICIPDTKVNYPIVQGRDNDYYLDRLVDKTRNKAGSIFLDYRSPADYSARNNIIYGHHMKNGSMFAALVKYKDSAFFEAHPYIMILTPEGDYWVEIVSAYVTKATGSAWDRDFTSDEDFEAWLNEILHASDFDAGIYPTAQDKILTLSTCTYEYNDARYVVHGVVHPREAD